MIEKGKYYVNRFSVGRYHVYLALEDAEEMDTLTKAIDLTDNGRTYIQSEHVFEVEPESVDKEYLKVAEKYVRYPDDE